jgi:hypothetical protein
MKEPKTVPWNISISNADLEKLKAGFEPQTQDHKWCIWVSEQNQDGNITITFARAAFRRELYAFHIKEGDGGSSIEAFTWEQNNGVVRVPEEVAKKQVVATSRAILKCDLEALPV